ncbi:NAD(P)/FAD-dependent oxidoreductase [Luteimonas abyssi]|uniref:NAD(P)/FAD-dependent oxidoreductase n=1 Tax=Luteimonas abyssi TaxID=1247514 RepID=UPI000737BDDB|nr:FAD-dependent oxidoreductase [Luteimonas abyssi]
MDLKSGYPFWSVKNGLMYAFPRLEADLRCDVAVIGGGITGALIADELARHGHDVAVVEQRDIGWGSTSASTALLQYEIDTHLLDLALRFGEDAAVLAYRACAEAIPMLRSVAADLRDVAFEPRDSLYYASHRWHRGTLEDEARLRARHGFEVEWLDRDALQTRYGFEAPGAILSACAAVVDPYRMASRLFHRLLAGGTGVYDRTRIVDLSPGARQVTLRTEGGQRIVARHVVVAAGYASQHWLSARVASNRSSYAMITDPIDDAHLGVLAHTLVWESARPYLYMRTTDDGRLLVGGEDDAVDVPARRDARVQKKAARLRRKVKALFPRLAINPAFSWAGTFAETDDGLPFFGAHPQQGPRVHFAMAYGGNGITYSMLGAGLLRAAIERRRHPLASLFAFSRV